MPGFQQEVTWETSGRWRCFSLKMSFKTLGAFELELGREIPSRPKLEQCRSLGGECVLMLCEQLVDKFSV